MTSIHVRKIRDVEHAADVLTQIDFVKSCELKEVDAGLGVATIRITIKTGNI